MRGLEPWDVLMEAADANRDGRIAHAELAGAFAALAVDGDTLRLPQRPARRAPAGAESGVGVGVEAPDFELLPPSGKGAVRLSSFRGKQPVALVFGSYT